MSIALYFFCFFTKKKKIRKTHTQQLPFHPSTYANAIFKSVIIQNYAALIRAHLKNFKELLSLISKLLSQTHPRVQVHIPRRSAKSSFKIIKPLSLQRAPTVHRHTVAQRRKRKQYISAAYFFSLSLCVCVCINKSVEASSQAHGGGAWG